MSDSSSLKFLHGIDEISKYMDNWSYNRLIRLTVKYGFPMWRQPTQTRRGWTWTAEVHLIDRWFEQMIGDSLRYLRGTKAGKQMAYAKAKITPNSVLSSDQTQTSDNNSSIPANQEILQSNQEDSHLSPNV